MFAGRMFIPHGSKLRRFRANVQVVCDVRWSQILLACLVELWHGREMGLKLVIHCSRELVTRLLRNRASAIRSRLADLLIPPKRLPDLVVWTWASCLVMAYLALVWTV